MPRAELQTGVLLVNLGTPDAPTAPAVRSFLREFLSDPRVVSLPRLLWWPILHGIILPRRPRRVAEAYREIWLEQGSPLRFYSSRIAAALAAALEPRLPVELGMRYGNPRLADALARLVERGARRVVVLPLFPQYSSSTTAAVVDAAQAAVRHIRVRPQPELRFVLDYHDHPAYIDALAQSIAEHRARHGGAGRLLMSFHGLPESYVRAGDPYQEQCHKSAALIARKLELGDAEWELVFQSRFGWQRWLQPYLDTRLRALPGSVRHIDVVCPGFATDCLETLEEIAMRGRRTFIDAGGRELRYIPALNDSPRHIAALAAIVAGHCRN